MVSNIASSRWWNGLFIGKWRTSRSGFHRVKKAMLEVHTWCIRRWIVSQFSCSYLMNDTGLSRMEQNTSNNPARENLSSSVLLKPVTCSLIRTGVVHYNCTSEILQKSLITWVFNYKEIQVKKCKLKNPSFRQGFFSRLRARLRNCA